MTESVELRGGRGTTVPDAEVRPYHDQPIIKPPVWTWEIPSYFFTGGVAGASSMLAARARAQGYPELARVARWSAAAGAVASPALLVSDLGKPSRFYNMLRVIRPTSPMNVGSWLLAAYGPAAGAAWLLAEVGRLPRLQRLSERTASLLGSTLSTYTAVLVADTAVPVWHEARRELPFVFAASSAAGAGAVGTIALPPRDAAPARRLAIAGGAGALAATKVMKKRLGFQAGPYECGRAGALSRAAQALTAGGAGVLTLFGRRRIGAVAGGSLLLAGALAERWAVFRAGFQSAEDPEYVRRLQRPDGRSSSPEAGQEERRRPALGS